MPDDPQPPNEPEPSEPSEPSPSGGDAEATQWRQRAQRYKRQLDEARPALQRLTELENASKSELERANEAARTALARAEQAELRALRMEVAARKGLTDAQARRLQGSTEEELEADADELRAAFAPKEPPPPEESLPLADRRPTPRLRPGAVPEAGPVETDPRKLAAQIKRSF